MANDAARVVYHFLEFYTGVFALVALSLAVMGGLLATNRRVVSARYRVRLQAVHRAVAAFALGCLVVHVTIKIVEAHAAVLDAFVPFASTHRRLFVGLGTIAAYPLTAVAWTGLVRRRFAQGSRPGLWRAVHVTAYPAWVLAIAHGLASGRPAAGWVKGSYVGCVTAVALALIVRVLLARRRHLSSPQSSPPSSARIDADRAYWLQLKGGPRR